MRPAVMTFGVVLLLGCGDDGGGDAGGDAATMDAATMDAAQLDASMDAATEDAVSPDCRGLGDPTMEEHRYAEIAGVDANLTSLDVYVPVRAAGCPPAPIMMWVHGGAWVLGDKRNQLADKVALFSGEGWLFVSTNYRLSPEMATTDPSAVRYPTHDEDVAAAFAWVREHAAMFGGDPDHIDLMGHSSGAGIISQLSTNPRFLEAHGLGREAIRCAALLDHEGYDVRAQCEAGNEIYLNAYGSDPAVWDEASAINHVASGAGIPPTFVVTRGLPMRIAMSQRYVDALLAASVPATLVNANPLDHEGVNDAVGAPGDTVVTPPLLTFLATCDR